MGFSSKAKRQIRAGEMLRKGMTAVDIARAFGLHPKSVRRLKRDCRTFNPDLAMQSRYKGRPPKVDKAKQDDVRLALLQRFSLTEHSVMRARRIIAEVSGVTYSPSHVYTLLRRLKVELPKSVLFGHYNHTKHRCNGCGALLVKRKCLLCMVREIAGKE